MEALHNEMNYISYLKAKHVAYYSSKLPQIIPSESNLMSQVRVPAPCQYAHKLALLVGDALHKVPNVGVMF